MIDINKEILAETIAISVIEKCGYPINLMGEKGIEEFKIYYLSKDKEILWIPGVRKSDLLKKYEINKESNILVASIEKSSFEHS